MACGCKKTRDTSRPVVAGENIDDFEPIVMEPPPKPPPMPIPQ